MACAPGECGGWGDLIGNACINIAFFLYLIYYLPQLYYNIVERENASKISLLTQGMMICAHSCNLAYAFGCQLPLQYKAPSMVALAALAVQEVQILLYYKRMAAGELSGKDAADSESTSAGGGPSTPNSECSASASSSSKTSGSGPTPTKIAPGGEPVKIGGSRKYEGLEDEEEARLVVPAEEEQDEEGGPPAGLRPVGLAQKGREEYLLLLVKVHAALLCLVFLAAFVYVANLKTTSARSHCHPGALAIGFVSAIGFFSMYVPQVLRNFAAKNGGGFSIWFLVLDCTTFVLHIVAAQLLALPIISTISPTCSLGVLGVLIFQWKVYRT